MSVWACYMCVAVQHVRAQTLSHVFINFPEPPSWYGWTVAAALLHMCQCNMQHTVSARALFGRTCDVRTLPIQTHCRKARMRSAAQRFVL